MYREIAYPSDTSKTPNISSIEIAKIAVYFLNTSCELVQSRHH